MAPPTVEDVFARRREIVAKEKHPLAFSLDKPLASLFCTFSITVLPLTLLRLEVWGFTALHVVLFVLKERGYELFMRGTESQWGIPLTFPAVGITSSFMSLLLVFFNSQCYSRYMSLYGACTGMAGAVQELAQTTAVHLTGPDGIDARWDACRYLAASVLVLYMRVTDIARNRPPTVDDEDWKRLTQSEEQWLGEAKTPDAPVKMPPMLHEHEVAILKKCGGKETQVLQMWAMQAVWNGYAAAGATAHFLPVTEIVLTCRKHVAAVPNTLDMPVPFPYYHALCGLMFVNYALYAITFLDLNSWLTPVAIFLIVATTTAVRELSSALANPFGDDEVDFNSSRSMHKLRGLITFLAHPVNVRTWVLAMPAQHSSAIQPAEQPQSHYYDGAAYYQPPTRAEPPLPLPPAMQFAMPIDAASAAPPMVYQYEEAATGDGASDERVALERSLAEQAVEMQRLRQTLDQYDYGPAAPPPLPSGPQPLAPARYEPPSCQGADGNAAAVEAPVYGGAGTGIPGIPGGYGYYGPAAGDSADAGMAAAAYMEGAEGPAAPAVGQQPGTAAAGGARRERKRFRQPFAKGAAVDVFDDFQDLARAAPDSPPRDLEAPSQPALRGVIQPPKSNRANGMRNVRSGADLGINPSSASDARLVVAMSDTLAPAPPQPPQPPQPMMPSQPSAMALPPVPPAPPAPAPAPPAAPLPAPPPPPTKPVNVVPFAGTKPDPEMQAAAAVARRKTLPLPSYKPEAQGEGKVRWRVAPPMPPPK